MRKVSAQLVALLLLAMTTGPAHAGGAVLELDEEFYVPGDLVRAYGTVWLESSMGRLEDGPYFAYLSRVVPRMPPPLPRDAVRVGRVRIAPRSDGRHGDVSVEFLLPRMDAGRYWLTVCDRPCSITLGDLVATELIVAADADAGRIAVLRETLSERIEGLQIQLRDRVFGYRAESLRSRITALERDVTRLSAEMRGLEDALEARPRPSGERRSSALPSLLAFVIPGAAAGFLIARRGRRPA